ncbi:MAG: hypothetical protein N2485_08550, partial [bacterium]|nr:hypothetical protein [bacterium]
SPDCAKPEFLVNGRYMKDEAQMHKNPSLALKMLDEMRKMYSTIYENYNYYWEFDNSPELLEWIIIPNDKFGFNEEPYTNGGIKNSKYVSYILVLGTQKDEIMMPYQEIFKNFDNIIFISRIIIIIYFIALIMSLLMIIWYFYNN